MLNAWLLPSLTFFYFKTYLSKTLLTDLSDSPTYLFRSSGPLTEIKLKAVKLIRKDLYFGIFTAVISDSFGQKGFSTTGGTIPFNKFIFVIQLTMLTIKLQLVYPILLAYTSMLIWWVLITTIRKMWKTEICYLRYSSWVLCGHLVKLQHLPMKHLEW